MLIPIFVIALILAVVLPIASTKNDFFRDNLPKLFLPVLVTAALSLANIAIISGRGGTIEDINKPNAIQTVITHFDFPFESVPEKGDIVVLYRYSCSDCQRLIPEIQQYAKKNGINITYVTVGSNAGKEIVAHAIGKEVPTAVYLGTQPNGPIYTTMQLMHTDGTLDTHTLDVMQQLKQNNEQESTL